MSFKKCFIFTSIIWSIMILPAIQLGQVPESDPPVAYEIWGELDDQNRTLAGKETIRWTNTTGDRIPDIWFHLYWNTFKNEHSTVMQEIREADNMGARFQKKLKKSERGWINIKSIQTGTGTDITHTMEFLQVDEPVRPHDQTVMRISLPEPLAPGETITLKLVFELKIPLSVARSGYYHNSFFFGQWFPKPGVYQEGKGWNCHHYHQTSEYFADFASYTVHMTVPSQYVVGSSGKEIRKTVNDNRATYTYSQKWIHDFAWVADPDFIKIERDFVPGEWITEEEYRKTAQMVQQPLEAIRLKKIKMILLINPEHRTQVEKHFTALARAIKYYGLWYGPYPYETITLVDPPYRNDCGGMEYPTLITGGTMIFPSVSPIYPDMVIIHEFGHNYWYGLNANNEFEEAWLDEGINSYSDGKVMSEIYGPYSMPMYHNGIPMDRYFKHFTFHKYELDRAGALNIMKTDPIMRNAWEFDSPFSFGMNVYMRAAVCLYTLEHILGEDTMMRVLRTFHNRFRYKHPVTEDFIRVVNEISRRDFTWFFEELFFKANVFDYAVGAVKTLKELPPPDTGETEKKSEDNTYLSIIKIRRRGEARLGGDVKLDILVTFEDGNQKTMYWDGQDRWKAFRISSPSKIKTVRIDPMNRFLIDANLTNNSYRRHENKTASRKIGSKILFYIQNLFLAVSMFS